MPRARPRRVRYLEGMELARAARRARGLGRRAGASPFSSREALVLVTANNGKWTKFAIPLTLTDLGPCSRPLSRELVVS